MDITKSTTRMAMAKLILRTIISLIFLVVFVANAYAATTVTVTYPNGGEVWGVGDTKRIQWSPSGSFTSFTIQISRDGGSSWSNLETGLPGNYTYRDWVVTSPGSTSCRLKVIGYYSGGSVEDTSNSNFTIGQLTVTSPNGGESWQAGTSHNITWTSSGVTGSIQIQPYLNGVAQSPITTSATNTGSYTWQIPEGYTPGTTYKMALSAMSGNVSDFSNANFSITAPVRAISLTYPNGGEVWGVGDTKRIQWSPSGSFTSFTIQISRDGGSSWSNLETGLPGNYTYRDWVVTSPGSTSCRLKVIGYYSGGSVEDTSNSNFTIGQLTVTSPNGGESWQAGTSHNITWTSSGVTGSIQIQPYLNGVAQSPITTSATNTGSYTWQIPEGYTPGTTYKMALSAMSGNVSDFSNANFSITAPVRAISLTYPNGGEVWGVGDTKRIQWSPSGSFTSFTIQISRDGGSSWSNLETGLPGDYTYRDWVVTSPGSTSCRLKVIGYYSGGSVEDTSNSNFTIGQLTVTSPNGGESWQAGTSHNITWTSSGVTGSIQIQPYLNGVAQSPITTSATNTGSYTWQIPEGYTPGTTYKMALSAMSGNVSDFSNANFSITAPVRAISLTYPNGGEVWGVGDTKRIQWSPSGSFTSFTIQISRDGGSSWSNLETGLPGDYTYRDWVVTSPGSTSCRLKVIGYYSGGSVEDTSNSNFTIGQLTVTSPNGGESWQAGTSHNITWTSSGVTGSIQIQPYLNGVAQSPITTSATNTGSYTWQIPEGYTPGTTYKMALSAMSGNVSDFSNANFSITAPVRAISLTYPNGGEVWGVGDTKRIQWSPSGSFTSFTIQISRDGGSSWSNLETGLPGDYTYRDWVVTSPGSTSCRLKVIGYYSGGSVEDTSNSNFTIGQLTVTSPNGGESWQAGTSHNITWTSSGVTGSIQIQPYLNGVAQSPITTSATNTGSYTWQIPEGYTPGTTYKMALSAMSGNVSDFSNANFSIQSATTPHHGKLNVTMLSGSEIYTPPLANYKYRYGPSIILNGDTFDMWAAAPDETVLPEGDDRWDRIEHRRGKISPDGTVQWITSWKSVLEGTLKSRDRYSACDPGVVYFNGYYYIGYTSTDQKIGDGATSNDVFVARFNGLPDGSPGVIGEKWNGSGWGGSPQPIIEYDGPNWGIGQPSFVVKDNILYLYYTDYGTKVLTVDATDENWPLLIDKAQAITIIDKARETQILGGAPGPFEVKYIDEYGKFIGIGVSSEFSTASNIFVYESLDGINFEPIAVDKSYWGSAPIQSMAHNIGISGDSQGHMDVSGANFVAYGFGLPRSVLDSDGFRARWPTYLNLLTISASGCDYSIEPMSQNFGANGGSGSINVTAESGCSWAASSNAPWITITSGSSGIGNGSIHYSVTPNTGGARNSTITLEGQTFTITQGAVECSTSISPTSNNFGSNGGSQIVTIDTNLSSCDWTASNSLSWVTLSQTSGTGDGMVTVTASANSGDARSGTVMIADHVFTVNQDAAGCSYSIAPTNTTFSESGGSITVTVNTNSLCEWSISKDLDWVSVVPASGSGTGTVTVTVSANNGEARSGIIMIANQKFFFSQSATTTCTYDIDPTNQTFDFSGGSQVVSVDTNLASCEWNVQDVPNWVSVSPTSGIGDGTVTITVSVNSGESRNGTITLANHTFTVSQDASDCTYDISPTNQTFNSEGGTQVVSVDTNLTYCEWNVQDIPNWVTVTPTSGIGDGTVTVTVSANSGEARNGIITIAGHSFSFSQQALTQIPTAHIEIIHSYRGDLIVDLGVGDPISPKWSKRVWSGEGGSEDNLLLDIDISGGSAYLPPKRFNRWYLKVYDQCGGDQGIINQFSISSGSTYQSNTTPIPIVDYNTSYAFIGGGISSLAPQIELLLNSDDQIV